VKKLIIVTLALFVLAASAFAQVDLAKIKNGVYFAQSEDFSKSGWKEQVVVEVNNGRIVSVEWNGVSNIAGAADKKSFAAAGKYGMGKASKIKAEWDAQAKAAEAFLVKTQDINFSKFSADGKTDAITGASLTVSEFFALAQAALAQAPVAKGSYKSGWYYKEAGNFDKSGWKETVLITVANGSIVDVVWNSIPKDSAKKSKILESKSGGYKMNAKNGEWFVQAKRVEAAIVKAGDPSKIAMKADGKTDAISGVSITANAVGLAIEALKAAK